MDIVKCTAKCIAEVNMISEDGLLFKASLDGVIYIPGMKRHVFFCFYLCRYRSIHNHQEE
jgi:hypothetical protein